MRAYRMAVTAGAALAAALAAGTAEARDPGPGIAGSIADWIKRTGDDFREVTVFGFKPSLKFSEMVEYTDNVYYAAKNETIIVDYNPDRLLGDTVRARPDFGKPPGRSYDIRNTLDLNVSLDWKIRPDLAGLLAETPDKVTVLGLDLTQVEYSHRGGPDAFNVGLRSEVPFLLNDLLKFKTAGHRLWFEAKGDYSRITDPLGVQKFELNNNQLHRLSNVESFERVEWSGTGTLGWKGPRLDAKVTGRYYSMSFTSSQFRQAEHVESSWYGEVGYTLPKTDQRFYPFYEYTDFAFDGNKDFANAGVSDFARTRTGLGWEGTLLSKKLKGRAEVDYIATENFLNGLPDPALFAEEHAIGGMFRLMYKPWQKRDAQFQLEYNRVVDWSSVSHDKVIDRATFTVTNRFNKRLTGEFLYMLENTQVGGPGTRLKPGTIGVVTAPGNIRLYQEFGVGLKYELFKYGTLEARYTLRHQGSRKERATIFSDASNQPYIVQPDNDFNVNVISLGLTIAF